MNLLRSILPKSIHTFSKSCFSSFSIFSILFFSVAVPLSAAQEEKETFASYIEKNGFNACAGCNSCRSEPSAVELLQIIREVLNDGLLLLPQLQPQLIAVVQQIVTEGGIGVVGPAGPAGPPGATGSAGGVLDYAYIYNLTPQTIAIEADVPFDTNGILTPGFIHAPNSSVILIVDAGVYKVDFSISGTEPNQFALFLNGSEVPGTVYGSGAGTQQNIGQAVFVMGAGDVITLRNHSSSAAVGLASNIGGTQANVNASITILRLSP